MSTKVKRWSQYSAEHSNEKLVAPSLLSANFVRLEEEIKKVEEAGADWLHVDIMDGVFVRNITIGMPVVSAIKNVSSIPLDVHLMIQNPEKYIDQFIDAGADILTIHVESTDKVEECLKRIRARGALSGITLRPVTEIEKIIPFLPFADLALVMTVDPGFGGQSFLEEQVSKMEFLKKYRREHQLDYWIEVDGGVSDKTVSKCQSADALVAGSFVFKNNYQQAIDLLK